MKFNILKFNLKKENVISEIKEILGRDIFLISFLLIFCFINILIRNYFFNFTFSSDAQEFLDTARLFNGDVGAVTHVFRILKPLAPLIMVLFHRLLQLDFYSSFYLEVILMYILSCVIGYLFFKSFFKDKILAFVSTLLFVCSYPALKYGLDLFTETGAWFFYLLGLFSVWNFYLRKNWLNLFISNLVIIIGFLWKEYSILVGFLLVFVIIFDKSIMVNKKARYLFFSGLFSLIFFLIWQFFTYQEFNYSYFSWYYSRVNTSSFSFTHLFYYTIKSLSAVFLLGWGLVFLGFKQFKILNSKQNFFIRNLLAASCLFLFWSLTSTKLFAISSRLYNFLSPLLILLSIVGLSLFKRPWVKVVVIISIVIINYLWLFLSSDFKNILDSI